MPFKGNLLENEVLQVISHVELHQLKALNCEPTGRLMPPGFEDYVEFKAEFENEFVRVTAYYYQELEDIKNTEDLSNLDWLIRGYEIDVQDHSDYKDEDDFIDKMGSDKDELIKLINDSSYTNFIDSLPYSVNFNDSTALQFFNKYRVK